MAPGCCNALKKEFCRERAAFGHTKSSKFGGSCVSTVDLIPNQWIIRVRSLHGDYRSTSSFFDKSSRVSAGDV